MKKVAMARTRVMRIIWFCFVLAGAMLMYIAFTVPSQLPGASDPTVEMILTVMALFGVTLGFFMPRILKRSARRAREGQTESAAMNAWFRDNLIGLAWIYSCNVFALSLHILGAGVGYVELLFGVGMISLLLWKPGTPPGSGKESLT